LNVITNGHGSAVHNYHIDSHLCPSNMSGEYAFRKIDIDALDEDVLLPTDLYDPDPRDAQEVTSQASQKANEARSLVSR